MIYSRPSVWAHRNCSKSGHEPTPGRNCHAGDNPPVSGECAKEGIASPSHEVGCRLFHKVAKLENRSGTFTKNFLLALCLGMCRLESTADQPDNADGAGMAVACPESVSNRNEKRTQGLQESVPTSHTRVCDIHSRCATPQYRPSATNIQVQAFFRFGSCV